MCKQRSALECIQVFPNQSLQVVVTRVASPFDFSVQPHGPELVKLMEDIGYVE